MHIDGLNAVRYYFSIRMQIKQRMLRSFLEDSYYANLLAPILPLLSNAPFFSTKSVLVERRLTAIVNCSYIIEDN